MKQRQSSCLFGSGGDIGGDKKWVIARHPCFFYPYNLQILSLNKDNYKNLFVAC